MKVVTVVGARPQFVKMAPVSKALRRVATEVVVHTGQHYDGGLSQVFFDELALPAPDHHLGVGSGSHAEQTARALERLEAVFRKEVPDVVLVYGDTNSTLAAALAAAKLQVPVAHVEAGPRTRDRRMPEEVNRIVVDHLSDLLFAPTPRSAANLAREGLADRTRLVGDVMVDALEQARQRARSASDVLRRLAVPEKGFCLATVHRADNTDDPGRLRGLVEGLRSLPLQVVFPVHPRTRARAADAGITLDGGNLMAVGPVGYLDMIRLEEAAAVVVTDSGGVQKEAYLAGVPCVTVQESTAWPETVEDGWNRLAAPRADAIAAAVAAARPGVPGHAFGAPGASDAIVRHLLEEYT